MAAVRASGGTLLETGTVVLGLACIGTLAASFVFRNGWTLYYGDAEAHFNIARRIVDAREPGYSQIGTAWLPLPHLLMLPFVSKDAWWRSGFAGVVPSVACFIAGGTFLFAALRTLFESSSAALASLGIFVLNPNVLYLSSIPMTEPIFFAALFGLLWSLVRFSKSPSLQWAVVAGLANLAAALTRYEGWFLIPFVALFIWIAAPRRRSLTAVLFAAVATAGPLWWLGHNYYFYGDVLEFFNGKDSAKGIYQRALDAGMARYPGDHDWRQALHYYGAAVLAVAGISTEVLALLGLFTMLRKSLWLPAVFLSLPPLFYVLSMHSSGTPIFLPTLWPFSYYNTRYGLAAFPLLAYCAGALVRLAPPRNHKSAALAIVIVATIPWLIHLRQRQEESICWRESLVNSRGRRAWTHKAAEILAANYRPGTGIIAPFGDLTGIFREAGIPQRETLHESDYPAWNAAIANPRFFLRDEWAVAISGDSLATAILRCRRTGPRYWRVGEIAEKGAPVIEIYKRD